MTLNDYHIYRMPYCWHALKHSIMADSYRPINERKLLRWAYRYSWEFSILFSFDTLTPPSLQKKELMFTAFIF